MTTDKPLPVNDEAERSVVGSVLIDSSTLDQVSWLTPDHFWDTRLATIWGVLLEMHEADTAIDLLSVRDRVRDKIDAPFLSSLTDGIPNLTNIANYAAIVRRDANRRAGIRACESAMQSFWRDQDVAGSANAVMDAVSELAEDEDTTRPLTSRDMAIKGLALMDQRLSGKHEDVAVPTGFMGIDQHMDGFTRGVLSIVAGRPGEGKTAWVLNCMLQQALSGYHSLFFSLDMSQGMVQDRLLSTASGVDAAFVKRGKPTGGGLYANMSIDELMERVGEGAKRLAEAPGSITTVDDAYDVSEILGHCRKAARDKRLDVVYVDYVQSVTSSNLRSDREDLRVKHVVTKFNQFAKRNKVAMVLLSQYNRKVYDFDRPHKGLLAEASTLERDARNVFLVWRPGMSKREDDKPPCKTILIADKASEYGERDFDMHYEGACYTFKEHMHGPDCYYWKGA